MSVQSSISVEGNEGEEARESCHGRAVDKQFPKQLTWFRQSSQQILVQFFISLFVCFFFFRLPVMKKTKLWRTFISILQSVQFKPA